MIAAALLVLVLGGCPAGPTGPAPQPFPSASPVIGVPPPARPDRNTLLVVEKVAGSREVGSFAALPGELWIGGRCSGGDIELHLDPLAVLPMQCDRLRDLPFQNQITLRNPRQLTLSVVAPEGVVWGLRVEQDR